MRRPAGIVRATLCSAILLLTAGPGAPARGAPCGPGDRPETGISGQVPLADQLSRRSAEGYSCNLSLVASTDLGSGGDTQMTWYGDCVYRSVPAGGGDGIAVVDVSDPSHPTLVRVLQEPEWSGRGGVLGIHEGIHASAARGILVIPIGTMLTTYEVSEDCTAPRLLSHFDFGFPAEPFKGRAFQGAGIHSGQLSPDGTFYYATDIGNGAISPTGPCLTIVDLLDVANPKLVMRWGDEFPCHDLDFNTDGTRAYLGFYESMVGHPSAVVGAFTPAVQPAHLLSGLRIADTSEVQARVPNPEIRILGELTGGRQHTETYTRIGGRSYVVAADEGFCPGGNARIVDVTDDAHPVAVSELTLGVNTLPGCLATQPDLDVGSNILLYMSHYISVDDPQDASLAFISWYGSGLRVFDIRDPFHPAEVAYFNPAVVGSDRVHDSTTTYPRYIPETGQVWVGSGVNALSILSLDPALRP